MVEFPVKDGEESLGVNWEMGKVLTLTGTVTPSKTKTETVSYS